MNSLVVGTCIDCGRGLIPQPVWNRKPQVRDHEKYARAGGHGMCNGCYSRAWKAGTLPDPAPRAPVFPVPDVRIAARYPVTCASCGLVAEPTRWEDANRAWIDHRARHRNGEIGGERN